MEENKNADEMFEELGYVKMKNEKYSITYKKGTDSCMYFINFGLISEMITCETVDGDYDCTIPSYLRIQELQAINKQVEELGW